MCIFFSSGMYERDIIMYYTSNFGKSMDTHLSFKLSSSSVAVLQWLQSGTIKLYTYILGLNMLFISNKIAWNSCDKFQECISFLFGMGY